MTRRRAMCAEVEQPTVIAAARHRAMWAEAERRLVPVPSDVGVRASSDVGRAAPVSGPGGGDDAS